MKSSPHNTSTSKLSFWQLPALAVGDLLMLLLFVVIGRISHGMTSDWLVNVLRIATPFVAGWFITAFLLGLYRPHLREMPGAFLARSAAGVVVANGLAFLLRSAFFQNRVTIPFALTSLAFTALFLLAWRLLFLVLRRLLSGAALDDTANSLT
ncbi:MAG: DUF3054 domain-containing protein [Chloroflexi bacterium]|nr:DUF3054 domain-containing protein [Chloroflexota bacterium]